MNTQTITAEKASILYANLRATPKEQWLGQPDEKALDAFIARINSNSDYKIPNKYKFFSGMSLMGRLAHQVDEKEFADCLATGEFPPMKLTAQEQELLRGGWLITAGWVAVGVVGAVGAAVGGYYVGKRL